MLRIVLAVLFLSVVSLTSASADINVFIYHRFDESRYPSTNISLEIFRQQLEYLKTHQYQVLPLSEIARLVRSGEPLPEKTVGLCVDDAFSSFGEHAVPLLQTYGYPATLFVNTDAVGAAGYMGWDELREVLAKGVELGNHTASHAYLVEREAGETQADWHKRISEDIARSKAELKQHLQVEPEIFAYTYGEYSPEVIEIVREAGFKSAFAQQSGVISASSDIWILPRFPMGGPYANMKGFVSKLQMRDLGIASEEPRNPILGAQNPPVLRLKLKNAALASGQFNCFAQAGSACRVEVENANEGILRVVGDEPLKNRRNKYTLTTRGNDGHWYWYSHLWINAKRPAFGE